MNREYGGYMPLELREGSEYFDRFPEANTERFNCGRNAIVAAALSIPNVSMCIPFYNCNVVRDTLDEYHIPYRQYYLNDVLEPEIDGLAENEWLLYVNYFGVASDEKLRKIAMTYERVIFDNTQAFFAEPILDGVCFNAYSPRKFVGVCDGSYLIWSGSHIVKSDYPVDASWDRAGYLFKSIEMGTNAAYKDNLESKKPLENGIKRMSVLTKKMLKSIDYDFVIEKRIRNYRVLERKLTAINQRPFLLEGSAPFIYPFYFENNEVRKRLVNNRIYVPQWWKYLLDEVWEGSIEAKMCQWLFPLPIDQRYSETDMEEMADIVIRCVVG